MHLPVYHFTSPTGRDCMPFDPNGAVFYNGRYHLGFIYQEDDKHFWGHVSSADLIHWTLQPPMLSPGPEGGIFSGNGFVDRLGRAVLTYHGLPGPGGHPAGNCLAIGIDPDLDTFEKLPGNPVMQNPAWDPHTWLHEGVYYSISGGTPGAPSHPSLYRCEVDTLDKWEFIGPLMSHELPDVFPDEDISCPDMFTLGGKHILLCISHSRGARYYIGCFDGKRFHPESHHRMMWPGGTYFAPETLLDSSDRRLLWAWVLGSPSTMSLPRVLTMGEDGELRISPAEELQRLRGEQVAHRSGTIPAGSEMIVDEASGNCMELRIRIHPHASRRFGVAVRRSPGGEEQTRIVCDRDKGVLRIDLERSSANPEVVYRTYAMSVVLPKGTPDPEVDCQEAPFTLADGEHLDLVIYLDHSIIEVFANNRQCLTQRIWPTREDSVGVSLFSDSCASLERFDAWQMGGITLER